MCHLICPQDLFCKLLPSIKFVLLTDLIATYFQEVVYKFSLTVNVVESLVLLLVCCGTHTGTGSGTVNGDMTEALLGSPPQYAKPSSHRWHSNSL